MRAASASSACLAALLLATGCAGPRAEAHPAPAAGTTPAIAAPAKAAPAPAAAPAPIPAPAPAATAKAPTAPPPTIPAPAAAAAAAAAAEPAPTATPAPAPPAARAAPAKTTQAPPAAKVPAADGLPTLTLDEGGRVIEMQGAPARIVIPDGWRLASRKPHRLIFTRTPIAGTVRPVIQVQVTAAADPADVPSVVHDVVVLAFVPVDGGDASKVKLPDGWDGGALGQSGVSGQGEVKVGGKAYPTRWRYFEATGGHTRLSISGACPERGPDSCDVEFASVTSSFLDSVTNK